LFAGGRDEVAAFGAADGRLLWTHAVAGDAYGLAVKITVENAWSGVKTSDLK